VLRLGLPLTLTACGGDSVPPAATKGAAPIQTLAYVVSECRGNGAEFFERYALVVQNGERAPVTVAEIPELGPAESAIGDACQLLGLQRIGDLSIARGGFTRLGVSPDGSTVVFEQTDEFSVAFHDFLAPKQEGIFSVRADGTGLRRLGPASREPPFVFPTVNLFPHYAFSPDGRTIVYPDRGPSLAGEDASQVFTLNLTTGARAQLTHLPFVAPGQAFTAVFRPFFLDNETILFYSLANPDRPDDPNTEGTVFGFTVKVDGSDLETLTSPVASPGAQIVPVFAITGAHPTAVVLPVPGEPVGPPVTAPPRTTIQDLFVLDGKNLLQLTNFRRSDTAEFGALVGVGGQHVFFPASADPLGTNPTENCQLFSIDRTGADLRQLTNFQEVDRSQAGCDFNVHPGCGVELIAQDTANQTLIFASGCNPFGMNPRGGQIFAIHPDGSGLRQLTDLRELKTDPDGTVRAELPGPVAYGPGLGALP
jgi:hypothetical protein